MNRLGARPRRHRRLWIFAPREHGRRGRQPRDARQGRSALVVRVLLRRARLARRRRARAPRRLAHGALSAPASAKTPTGSGRVAVTQRPAAHRATTETCCATGGGPAHGGQRGAGRAGGPRTKRAARARQLASALREIATPGSPGHDPHSPQRNPPRPPTRTQSLSREHSRGARCCARSITALVGFSDGDSPVTILARDGAAHSLAAQPDNASDNGSARTSARCEGVMGPAFSISRPRERRSPPCTDTIRNRNIDEPLNACLSRRESGTANRAAPPKLQRAPRPHRRRKLHG